MGILAVGSLPGYAAVKVPTKSGQEQKAPVLALLAEQHRGTLTAGSLSFAYHAGSRTDSLSGGFFVLFRVACGLLGFMHPEKVRGVCVSMT